MKSLCLLLFLSLFLSQCVSAQTVGKKQNVAGSSGDDEGLAGIITTRDGGLLSASSSNSLPDVYKNAPNYGGFDYWIVKYDKNGKKQFDKSYGSSGYDEIHSVIQTSDGGYLIGGQAPTGVSGSKTDSGKGGGDMWVVKTDSLGRQLWNKTYGGSDEEILDCLSPARDGGYILCGYSFSGISGNKTEASYGSADFWVVKIDASGNVQWNRTFGGDKFDRAKSVVQTADGGYFVAGISQSGQTGNKTTATRGNVDIWILKTDSLGNKLWDRTIGGRSTEELVTMDVDPAGGYVLGAYSNSAVSGDKTEATKGSDDYWVVKVNASGIIQWQKDIGSTGTDELSSIKVTTDGGCIVAGYSDGNASGDKTENLRGNTGAFEAFDAWVVKLSPSHTIEWDKTVGGDAVDEPGTNAIVQTSADQYIVSASSNSPANYDKTVANRGGYDNWLFAIQYNPLARDNNKAVVLPLAALSSSFTVMPNPVRDVMHVQATGNTTITLSGSDGRPVLTKVVNGKEDIRVSNLPAGTYYLKNNTSGEVKKVMIVK